MVVELIRLSVVILGTAVFFELASQLGFVQELIEQSENWLVAVAVLGAGLGYVAGGVLGRFALGRIDLAERRFQDLSAGELIAGSVGGLVGLVIAAGLSWPVLLFEGKLFTVPIAVLISVLLVATGVRIGTARGGDLLRYVGASGRLAVSAPASGPRAKVVDTSALIDGRILDVCRSRFLEGTLVIPRYVLYELQGLADAGDEERRMRGRRGLDILAGLQHSAGVSLEVSEQDHPEIEAVDAKLIATARARRASLVTVDGNLGRVAEVQGITVLNLHALAEHLRPPVLPGEVLEVRITRPGRESSQGVGYLSDGTMVIVEGARHQQGQLVNAEVTSILSNPNGRMVFGTVRASPHLVHDADA